VLWLSPRISLLFHVKLGKRLFFHDESTFNANEDQHYQWGVKGQHMLWPKSKGAGIMVSDFVNEHNGYLALTDEEYQSALKKDKTIKR